MFEVRVTYTIGENWELIDTQLRNAALRRSSYSGTDGKTRYHCWYVIDFDQARELRDRLSVVAGVSATVREK